jgi:hypothetical protein
MIKKILSPYQYFYFIIYNYDILGSKAEGWIYLHQYLIGGSVFIYLCVIFNWTDAVHIPFDFKNYWYYIAIFIVLIMILNKYLYTRKNQKEKIFKKFTGETLTSRRLGIIWLIIFWFGGLALIIHAALLAHSVFIY